MAGKEGEILLEDFNEIKENEEDEGEEVTAAEVVQRLQQAWLNEKFAPEILDSKIELVECMLEQINDMEENLSNVSKVDLVGSFHKLEIQRIRYVINSYLKIRLKKIEKYAFHISYPHEEETIDYMSRLSPDEQTYLKEYRENVQELFEKTAFEKFPPNIKKIDFSKIAPRPNLESYLFIKVLQPQEQVELDPDDHPVDLEENAQHLVRYNVISTLLENDSISLI